MSQITIESLDPTIMPGENHRKKLDELNEAVTDRLLARIRGEELDSDGNQVPLSNDDLRVIQMQLKNNQISAAAMPDSPAERMQRLLRGLGVSPGHLEARQKALPHLLPSLTADPADGATAQGPGEW